jgi:hypothetical protein
VKANGIIEMLLGGYFENKVLRRIFGPKREREREELTRGWGKLHNEDLHNF